MQDSPVKTRDESDGEDMSNTDLDSNRILYNNLHSDGVSPIKVEDESEEVNPADPSRLR